MQYHKLNISFLIAFLFIVTGCSGVNNSPFLEDGWTCVIGSIEESPTQAMNKEFKPVQNLYNLHQLVNGGEGIIWLKKQFYLPDRLKDKRLALMLGRTNLADKTYLNGELIGSGGRFPPDFFSDWNSYRYYTIPSTILEKEKLNTLLVQLYVNQEGF